MVKIKHIMATAGIFSIFQMATAKEPWNVKPAPRAFEDKNLTHQFKFSKPLGKMNLKLNEERLKKLDLGGAALYFSREEIARLPEILKKDEKARKTWGWLTVKAKKTIQSYYKPKGKDEKYIYKLGGLKIPAFVWMCTGDKELGRALKAIILDAAKRPMSFWIHSHLRKYNPEYPVGGLETGSAGSGIATAWLWTRGLWTPDEDKFMREAIRVKVMYPIMRFLEVPRDHYSNWQAAMAGSGIIVARVLGEKKAEELAADGLKKWLTAFEDDGSYNEPLSYLWFGVANFIPGAIAQGKEKAIEFAQGTHLKGTLEYLVYNYCAPKHPTNGRSAIGVNFGDGDFPCIPHQAMCTYLSYAFNNGLGLWLNQRFSGGRYDFDSMLMRIIFDKSSLKPVSPEELKLPAAKYFDCGIGFIRLGWSPFKEIMLAMRSGGGGKTKWAHNYPNRNAIMLIQDGELMLNTPGRASYRNPLHNSYDKLISSHCAVNFGNKNQNKKAVAKMLSVGNTADFASLVNEAAESYNKENPPPQRVRRRILCIKKPRIFVMWDEMIKKRNNDTVNWRFYFNNYDGIGKMTKLAQDMIEYKRRDVALKVFTVSDAKAEYSFGKGIMHKGYSYFPGAPNEGKMGSSLFWLCRNTGKTDNTSFYSVFGPPGWNAVEEKHSGSKVIIISLDKEKYEISFSAPGQQIAQGSMQCVYYRDGKQIQKVVLYDDKGLVNK